MTVYIDTNFIFECLYSQTPIKRTPLGTRLGVRLIGVYYFINRGILLYYFTSKRNNMK